jgi:hypothetical protein
MTHELARAGLAASKKIEPDSLDGQPVAATTRLAEKFSGWWWNYCPPMPGIAERAVSGRLLWIAVRCGGRINPAGRDARPASMLISQIANKSSNRV